jgi:hypothetical protein
MASRVAADMKLPTVRRVRGTDQEVDFGKGHDAKLAARITPKLIAVC